MLGHKQAQAVLATRLREGEVPSERSPYRRLQPVCAWLLLIWDEYGKCQEQIWNSMDRRFGKLPRETHCSS